MSTGTLWASCSRSASSPSSPPKPKPPPPPAPQGNRPNFPQSTGRPDHTSGRPSSLSNPPLSLPTEQADFFSRFRSRESVVLQARPFCLCRGTIHRALFTLPNSPPSTLSPCLHPFPHQRFPLFFPPYSVTLPSTTFPT